MAEPGATAQAAANQANVNTELAMRRTGMAFQRTRMAADRTLMAVIRTALSLIGFGFTIYQFFNKLKEAGVVHGTAAGERNFGTWLVLLGIGMLILGILYHIRFMLELRHQRAQMRSEGLIHAETNFPPSLVLIVAVVLLFLGVLAALSMVLHAGPLG
jgi:putative membrane protein